MFDERSVGLMVAVGAKLIFTIPATYPDVVPELRVDNMKGLAAKQCEALSDHIVEKVSDAGRSGSSLSRPILICGGLVS